jgi:hypothetical protein
MALCRRSRPKLQVLEVIGPRTTVYFFFSLNISVNEGYFQISSHRADSLGQPEDRTVGPFPAFPRTEVASVGPVLTYFFRSRPKAGPPLMPEDSVGLDRRPNEPARANPAIKELLVSVLLLWEHAHRVREPSLMVGQVPSSCSDMH